MTGIDGQICETFNDIAQVAEGLRAEVADLRQMVGREGRTHRRLGRSKARGGWRQGAVFGAVKAGVDRGGLKGFEKVTGVWAGES